MRALVVDDSKPVRGILTKMLTELNFEVESVADGGQAIERLETQLLPNIVMLNWTMPGVDGHEFLRRIRADFRFRNLTVVVVSGSDDSPTIHAAMAVGANGFLVKPVSKESLREKLSAVGVGDFQVAMIQTKNQAPVATNPMNASDPNPADKVTANPATPFLKPPQPTVPLVRTLATPLRVMIVDDSVVVRGVIGSVLEQDPDLVLAGSAADGRIAMDKLPSCNPDVVLLDIEMPNMDGFQTLKAIRQIHPRLPVIMFSSLTERGARATLDAMLMGANDYVMKPGGSYMRDAEAGQNAIRNELIPKIKQFGKPIIAGSSMQIPSNIRNESPRNPARPSKKIEIVAIGVSTGGPQALSELLPAFAKTCPVPIVIVQHMPPLFTKYLVERLQDGFGLKIFEGQEGQPLRPGEIYLAPGGSHMVVKKFGGTFRIGINQELPENSCRPSVDVLFRSVTAIYGAATLGVILTGMGNDGTRGCGEIRKAAGRVIVQDEASSVVWGMPGNVLRAGHADKILPLSEIAAEIQRAFRV